jgi:hypothetical protein
MDRVKGWRAALKKPQSTRQTAPALHRFLPSCITTT